MSLSADYIWGNIANETKLRLARLQVLATVDSTNEHLLRICQQSPGVSAMACLAEQQTAGRGRRGRHWCSPPKANIYLSVLWRYHVAPANRTILPLCVAMVIAEALKRIGVQDLALKWPNDFTWQRQKLGGLLCETRGGVHQPYSLVVGLGLNVRMPAEAPIDQPWIDLYHVLGESCPHRNELAVTVIDAITEALANPDKLEQADLPRAWSRWDSLYDQRVVLYDAGNVYEGVASGIDHQGHLLVNIDGHVRSFAHAEVSARMVR